LGKKKNINKVIKRLKLLVFYNLISKKKRSAKPKKKVSNNLEKYFKNNNFFEK
jgi:hypothetical protein